nr:FtsQ-type POTRA domain-containing protein [Actinomycetota bacterium]
MATLGRSAPRLRAAVTSRAPALPSLAGLAPSRLTGALAILAVVVGAGAYLLVRSTPVFAVRGIEVRGASPEVARQVRAALDPLLGANLVGLDGRRVRGALADVPDVAASSYDRGFPSTLRVWVVPERPVAVLRRGAERWLVSTRGRVLRPLDGAGRGLGLGRVWMPADAPLAAGDTLTDPHVRGAVRA